MGCKHRGPVDPILNDAGNVVGVRCPACGMEAFAGDSRWTAIKQAVRFAWRDAFGKTTKGER
jgi:hypothetical protein